MSKKVTLFKGSDRLPINLNMEVYEQTRKKQFPKLQYTNVQTPNEFKPMLACSTPNNLSELRFPLIASPKVDGIRCCIVNGKPKSRSLKDIKNQFIRQYLSEPLLSNVDGQLVIMDGQYTGTNHSVNFQRTTSAVMSQESEDAVNFKFLVFDYFGNPSIDYTKRLAYLQELVQEFHKTRDQNHVYILPSTIVQDLQELDKYQKMILEQGGEGIMLRKTLGLYKYGRCTPKQRWLMKLKRFNDIECQVIGFVQKQTNYNPSFISELGKSKRSTSKKNKIKAGTLGALVVNHTQFGIFNVGTGFDDSLKKEIWDNREKYLGKLVKIKYQQCGVKDKPRIPVFLGFRDKDDL